MSSNVIKVIRTRFCKRAREAVEVALKLLACGQAFIAANGIPISRDGLSMPAIWETTSHLKK